MPHDHQDPAPESPDAASTASDSRESLPITQKIAYGLGTPIDNWGNWLYPSLVWPVFNLYLGVPPWLVSAALFLNRLFDAVSDPFFGWWSDNTRTRWGRRRPFILFGGILTGVSLPMLVWVTTGWDSTTVNLLLHWDFELFGRQWSADLRNLVIPNYFWYMALSSALYITIVSSANVAWQSLGAELTPNVAERTSVYAFRTGIQKLFEVGLFSAAAFVTATAWNGATTDNVVSRFGLMFERMFSWFGDILARLFTFDFGGLLPLLANPFGWNTPTEGERNTLLGAQVYTITLGAILAVCSIIVFLSLRERYYQTVIARKQERIRLSDTVWKVLQSRPFRANLSMAFAYAMGTSMVGTLGYYTTVFYVCQGDQTVGGIWNFWMGVTNSVLGFFGVPIFAFLGQRFGKKHAMMCVQVSAAVIFLATWWLYDPETRWLQLFASGLIALTGAGFWMLYGSMGADVVDHDELEHGKRREGAFTACGQWIMKVGQATGIGFSGVVLSATGFDADLGADQSPGAIFNMRLFLAVIPIVGLAIAYLFLRRYPLTTGRMAEIRDVLETRRGKV